MSIFSFFTNLFKSPEQRAQEMRQAVRQAVFSLKKWESTLEKKKDAIFALAVEARRMGENAQCQLAVKGLQMIMASQSRARGMRLHIEIVSTMNEIQHMSRGFTKLLSDLGTDISKTIGSTDFIRSQASLEKGIQNVDSTIEKLEFFMENAQEAIGGMADVQSPITDEAITRLIDAQISGGLPNPAGDEIEKRLKALGGFDGKGGIE